MVRETLLVAARHRSVAESLERFFHLFFPTEAIQHEIVPLTFSCFADLSQQLDEIGAERLRHSILLLDTTEETTEIWNVGNRAPLGLATHIILAYPEVYPVFVVSDEPAKPPDATFQFHAYHFVGRNRLHEVLPLIDLHAHGFRMLFDSTGLRSMTRRHLFNRTGVHSAYESFSIERRRQYAAVADEEEPFVFLNAYAAYTCGYSAWLATSKREFSRLLSNRRPASGLPSPQQFDVAITDWNLVYHDDSGSDARKLLIEREGALDLPLVRAVIVVTSFPEDVYTPTGYSRAWTNRVITLAKPYGGLFRLIGQRLRDGNSPLGDSRRLVLAAVTAPRTDDTSPRPEHNAPFQCSLIASGLLHRWTAVMKGADRGTETSVHAAVLACDAKEILGGMSQTLAYEALACQNESEVEAEVSFLGMSSDLDISTRLKVLEQEAGVIMRRDSTRNTARDATSESNESRLNFLFHTANKLRLRLIEVEQVEASEECLRHFARYSSRAEKARILRADRMGTEPLPHPVINAKRADESVFDGFVSPPPFEALRVRIGWWITWYLDTATGAGTSMFRLFMWSVGWIVVFGVAFALMLPAAPHLNSGDRLELGLQHSAMAFIQIQSGIDAVERMIIPEPERTLPLSGTSGKLWFEARLIRKYELALFLELLVSYLHLGLLISVVHRRVTRRAP
jgi:hypothetical protein